VIAETDAATAADDSDTDTDADDGEDS